MANELKLKKLISDDLKYVPLYESLSTELAKGTAAQKLGASIDVVLPGKRACPYHFHLRFLRRDLIYWSISLYEKTW